ncbi:hypothetical protein SAMN05720354_11712 [Nitrosospira sp. Nsp1]|nr:hypothetical protein SAMN05720354_11712 [Nitrosospira sp. Nsp1]
MTRDRGITECFFQQAVFVLLVTLFEAVTFRPHARILITSVFSLTVTNTAPVLPLRIWRMFSTHQG